VDIVFALQKSSARLQRSHRTHTQTPQICQRSRHHLIKTLQSTIPVNIHPPSVAKEMPDTVTADTTAGYPERGWCLDLQGLQCRAFKCPPALR
jgi:hypothetical protein